MNILKNNWRGGGAFADFARWVNSVARRVSYVTVSGGEGKWDDNGLHLTIFGNNSPSENVYLWGRRYVATGTRARYLWVHYAASPPYAQWSSTGIDWSAPDAAMPDGVEVIDTNENALHFPFGG
jgi:hypothetical protein